MRASRAPGYGPPRWGRRGRRPARVQAIGGLPPPVVEIPFTWIASPLSRKPTTAITRAEVGLAGGSTAYSSASAAVTRQYGANTQPAITLLSAIDADAQNLADMLTTYQGVPRPRQPTCTFSLLDRTEDECLLLLSVDLAQRIHIIGAPPGTPDGAVHFVVEGRSHVVSVGQRLLTWATAALIGVATTAPGPWFRWGSSAYNGPDLRPF